MKSIAKMRFTNADFRAILCTAYETEDRKHGHARETTRCALCGSSIVVYRNGRYYCVSCGAKGDHPMSDAELAYIDQALSLGDDSAELAALRRRYPRLRVR